MGNCKQCGQDLKEKDDFYCVSHQWMEMVLKNDYSSENLRLVNETSRRALLYAKIQVLEFAKFGEELWD